MVRTVVVSILVLGAIALVSPRSAEAQEPARWSAGAGLIVADQPMPTGQYLFAARRVPLPSPWLRARVEGLFASGTRLDAGLVLAATTSLLATVAETRVASPYVVLGTGVATPGWFTVNGGIGAETRLHGRPVFAELRMHAFDAYSGPYGFLGLAFGTHF